MIYFKNLPLKDKPFSNNSLFNELLKRLDINVDEFVLVDYLCERSSIEKNKILDRYINLIFNPEIIELGIYVDIKEVYVFVFIKEIGKLLSDIYDGTENVEKILSLNKVITSDHLGFDIKYEEFLDKANNKYFENKVKNKLFEFFLEAAFNKSTEEFLKDLKRKNIYFKSPNPSVLKKIKGV